MIWLLALGCQPPEPARCNGAGCDTPYDLAMTATTHNAMSNADDGWVAPNQEHGIEAQLDAGIRGLMLDVHPWDGGVWLCHGDVGAFYTCTLGRRDARDAFAAIDGFLAAHPAEVVTLILESYVSFAEVEPAFVDSGLAARAHTQDPRAPWPTLGELVDADTRLVVLTDRDGGAAPWYLPAWEHAWDTPWAVADPADFDCSRGRGADDNALVILNHFVSDPLPSPAAAAVVNAPRFVEERIAGCASAWGRGPTFVAVDFYATGDVVRALAGSP